MTSRSWLLVAALAAASPISLPAQTQTLFKSFLTPPAGSRMMMRWWWFGPSVTKPGIERELTLMKAGGIGGVEVQPVYPVALDDPDKGYRNLTFLSGEFSTHLQHAAESAKRLGLRFDLTLGTGWPYGGPEIPVTRASSRLRRVTVAKPPFRIPDIGNGESLVAAFAGTDQGLKRFSPPAIPAGTKSAEYFIASRTGQMVKRASVGGEGFVLDHYDRQALDLYLAWTGTKLMDAVSGVKPYAIFCDSLESFGSDWTPDFPAEFLKRRGYDIVPLLPELAGHATTPQARAIRHDWGMTLTELLEERFIEPMQAFSRRHGVQFRIQGYGIPPATISTNRLVDLPEGEGPEWKDLRASRWASSASHLYGKPVTSSETWTWLHSPSFAATPLDMKAEADRHFLQGINQLIGHGWPYTAEGVDYPGWRFYAAAVFNEKNPWWTVMPELSRYVQRLSHLLRQGRPANTVALYLPNHDAWADFQMGRPHMIEVLKERLGPAVIPAILDAGYGFDFFDDAAVSRLEPGGYRIVVLPAVETIPAATLRALQALAGRGVIVLATRRLPDRAPGFQATAAQHQEIDGLARGFVKLVENEAALGPAMRAALAPDLAIEPAAPEVGFIRRELPDADVYFIANTSNRRQTGTVKPRSKWSAAEWWNPGSGERIGAGPLPVAFDLAPYESRVLILSAAAVPPLQPRVLTASQELTGAWTLRIPGESSPRSIPSLQPWTVLPDLLHYSGTADYETTITLPPASLGRGLDALLDFGEGRPIESSGKGPGMRALLEPPVREAAEVWVNGQRAGAVWAPPYRIAVTPLLRAGENRIRIQVANTAINHMAGRPLPDYRLLNSRFGSRFEPQDMDKLLPAPSGLTGPVRLIWNRSLQ